MDVKKDIMWRVYSVYFFICLFGAAIIFQTLRIQLVEGAHWKKRADSTTTDYRTIEAVRGNIYAEDGSLLATSLPVYEVRMDVNAETLTDAIFNKDLDSLCYHLSELFQNKTAKDYKKALRSARRNGERYFLLNREVSYNQLKTMRRFPMFRMGRYKGGLITLQKSRRERPFQLLASRTIGYERTGQPVGLEGAFNSYLTGVSGKRLSRKLSGGNWMPVNPDDDENEIEPEDGNDLMSTIDINIQDVAEHSLYTQLVQNNADHGCVVLMEVRTGAIKAIANLSRDPEGSYSESYNFAVGESTEPGSTFKLASLVCAIEDGYIDITDSVNTTGGSTRFYDRVMKDSHEGGFGKITIQKAFEVSSNVGISKVIYQNYAKQPQKFVDGLTRMHLDKALGLQVPGESNPKIKNTKDKYWYGTTLPWMSIGYELQMTPLQILAFYNAIANDGKMVKPLFATEVQKKGKIVKTFQPVVQPERICSHATIVKVKQLLEGVVERGTATNLKNDLYKIAGKTGTAQIADGNSSYKTTSKMRYQASFVGYFPAENPKYSCIVVINEPTNGIYYANVVAAPVFKDIADKVFAARLDMHKDLDQEKNIVPVIPPIAKQGLKKEKAVDTFCGPQISKGSEGDADKKWKEDESPDVRGMGLQDAVYLLENKGILVKVLGKGSVVKQSLEAGSNYEKGVEIVLELENKIYSSILTKN
jgi:cell division protein FtsI (penicillin-binding protein 3)